MPLLVLTLAAVVAVFVIVPRHRAAQRNAALVEAPKDRKDAVVRLLEEGAQIGAVDANGYTALITASYIGAYEILGLLLENGADVNQATRLGVTPLMAACAEAHAKVARLLLERGAGVNLRSHTDKTALGYAHDAVKHEEVRRVLAGFGALV